MAKIIDFNTMIKEPIEFVGLDRKKYTIPGSIPTKFTLQMRKLFIELQGKKEEETLETLFEFVYMILSMDKSKKNLTLEYVKENFDDMRILRLIVESTMEHIADIEKDPN